MYKLLIVDDNDVQLNYLKYCIDFSKLNIDEIKCAYDGEEAIEICKDYKPDIIITDVEMPVMDGVQMTKQLNKIMNVKIIFVSCFDDFSYVKEALENDAVSYILKPVEPEQLISVLKKSIEEIEHEKEYFRLNSLIQESMESFRENFVYRITHSGHLDESDIGNTLKNLGFDKYKYFCVAVFDISSNIYGFISIIKKDLLKNYNAVNVIVSEKRCFVLFMNDTCDDFVSKLKFSISEFCEEMMKENNITVNVGLSSLSNTIFDAKLLMNQATSMVEGKIFSSEYGIYEYNISDVKDYDYEIDEIKDSLIYIMQGDAEEKVEEFIDKYYIDGMSFETKKKLSVSIVSTLQLILTQRGINTNELYGSSAIIWEKLDRFETIPNVKIWLYNILKTAIEFLNDNECDRYQKIVSDITENINKNYADVSNVSDVIKDIYISASYAQSLYKKYTGKTISDYVTEKRIEKAKEMLLDPYVKVYEVSEKVGYKSKAHFSEIFKKYTGLTPKEFRQKG